MYAVAPRTKLTSPSPPMALKHSPGWAGTQPPPPIPEPWCLWLHPLFGVSAAPRLLLSRTSPECPQCTSTAHTRSHAIRDLPWDPNAQGQALRQTHASHPKLAPHLAIQTLLTLPALTPPASPAPPPPHPKHLYAPQSLTQENDFDWRVEQTGRARPLHPRMGLVHGFGVQQKWRSPPLQALLANQTHPIQTQKSNTLVSPAHYPKLGNHTNSQRETDCPFLLPVWFAGGHVAHAGL